GNIGWQTTRGSHDSLSGLVVVSRALAVGYLGCLVTFEKKECQFKDGLAILQDKVLRRTVSQPPIERTSKPRVYLRSHLGYALTHHRSRRRDKPHQHATRKDCLHSGYTEV